MSAVMKKLTIEIEDDGRFTAILAAADGSVITSARGNGENVLVMGAVHEMAGVIRALGVQQEAPPWKAWDSELVNEKVWGLRLPDGTIFGPLESPAAVHSVRVALFRMFAGLTECPARPFEVFLTTANQYGFFDRAGLLHAGLPTRQAAQELADTQQRSREAAA